MAKKQSEAKQSAPHNFKVLKVYGRKLTVNGQDIDTRCLSLESLPDVLKTAKGGSYRVFVPRSAVIGDIPETAFVEGATLRLSMQIEV